MKDILKKIISEILTMTFICVVVTTPIIFGLYYFRPTPEEHAEAARQKYQIQVKALPPGSKILEEKNENWWVIELDGKKYLAHVKNPNYNSCAWELTGIPNEKNN